MKFRIKATGSLILSALSLLLNIVAFLLGYVFESDWAIVLWWVVLPALLLFTLAYLAADLANGRTRRQAASAALIALPALLTEVWFFKNLRL